jgi:hypothetical protein
LVGIENSKFVLKTLKEGENMLKICSLIELGLFELMKGWASNFNCRPLMMLDDLKGL